MNSVRPVPKGQYSSGERLIKDMRRRFLDEYFSKPKPHYEKMVANSPLRLLQLRRYGSHDDVAQKSHTHATITLFLMS